MSAPARQLEDRLARIEQMLAELLARERPRDERGLYTKRAAARILGCDRATTLEQLIRSGRLRAVPGPSGKGLRIPREELERARRAGIGPAIASPEVPAPRSRKARASARGAAAADVAARIRAIPVPRSDE